MKLKLIIRQLDLKDTFKEELTALFEKKLKKLDKYFREDAVATITLRKIKEKEVLELTIVSGGLLYRSEVLEETFQIGIDTALAAIERQIRKNKTRLGKRLRDGAFERSVGDAPPALPELAADEEESEDDTFSIRDKSFALKPMSPEEAILQMNLLGHDFFVYRDDESGEVHVVYRRHDGKYGRILPTVE